MSLITKLPSFYDNDITKPIQDSLSFEAKLNEYLKSVTNELAYSKIYGLLANLLGVEDISSLTLNDNNINISIAEDKIINISSIDFTEVM